MKLHANARTCPNRRAARRAHREESGRSQRRPRPPESASAPLASGSLAGAPKGRRGCKTEARRRTRIPNRTPETRVEAIAALRRLRMTAPEIAELLGMALSTVSRWLKRIGLGKLSRLEPPEPPNRYERARPGELIHIDVKKLGRIERGAGQTVRSASATDQAAGCRLGARPRLHR